ncbi:PD-(D/E)XK motif protein [Persicitalea sp.]|uniref:PD-(D/E)XK motif protein n=1 Tax=Persicitalea sp. TaxID=3100273 RepID=UPI003593A42A
MNRIQQVWPQLENQTGVFRRIRYDATSPCDLNLGLRMPQNERMLVLRLPLALAKGIQSRPPALGLRVEKVGDPDDDTRFFLNLVLSEPRFAEVFDVLLEDLIARLIDIPGDRQVVREFLNHLDRWEALFSRYSSTGLTTEQQKGLYGELHLLRTLLTALTDKTSVLDSWVGQDAAVQDFRAGSWAIEVKTSSHATHERFTVNGERQLDESPLENLFLYYLNLDVRVRGGESLNAIVSTIRSMLAAEAALLSTFNRKLIDAGYFDAQADVYEENGYVIREKYIFRVTDSFPRITPADLRPGVGEVRYSASLSDCLPYEITEQQLFDTLS